MHDRNPNSGDRIMTSVTVGREVGCQILEPDGKDEFIKSYEQLDRQNFLHNLIRPISSTRRDLIELHETIFEFEFNFI